MAVKLQEDLLNPPAGTQGSTITTNRPIAVSGFLLLNDGLPSNEKVNIKPTNFKATASSIGRSNDAVTKNHKIKLVGMYQIEDKLTVVTVYLKFSKGYEELFVYEHDIEAFDPT